MFSEVLLIKYEYLFTMKRIKIDSNQMYKNSAKYFINGKNRINIMGLMAYNYSFKLDLNQIFGKCIPINSVYRFLSSVAQNELDTFARHREK